MTGGTGRAALFDIDGTLTDTNHLHVVCWWEALRQSGHRVPMGAVHRAVGLPGDDLVTHLLGPGDEEEHERIHTAHGVLYATYYDRLPALDGAADLLRRLAGDGWEVVLVTSASGAQLDALRRAMGADDAITAWTSADDVERGKPHPEPLQQALDLVGVGADRAVFVGDTVWDMRAAVRAGVARVGVLSGGIPAGDLRAAGAEAVYEGPRDVLAGLGTGPFARLPAAGG
ncbi:MULTISPECIES: HAD family hydrolase [Streptomyces]|uniref:HAD family hydrolase n=1 Tax=Streptomyces TaxID=1883 RepID=UPI00167776CD|nr:MULTISPECIES: HAD family hydrolase [Streptomyces]MBD3580012.1 HAD family hydrolase [Streptomyces sp. KD18]GGT20982.1 haloacid dehalogenase [Streptomyces toxytricini]